MGFFFIEFSEEIFSFLIAGVAIESSGCTSLSVSKSELSSGSGFKESISFSRYDLIYSKSNSSSEDYSFDSWPLIISSMILDQKLMYQSTRLTYLSYSIFSAPSGINCLIASYKSGRPSPCSADMKIGSSIVCKGLWSSWWYSSKISPMKPFSALLATTIKGGIWISSFGSTLVTFLTTLSSIWIVSTCL